MRANCIQAVEAVLGRKLKAPETQDIENRITRNLRSLAAEDPAAFRSLTPAQQLQEAAARASVEIGAEHAKKQQRIALTVLAHQNIERVLAQNPNIPLDGINALLQTRTDQTWNVQSVESRVNAVRNMTLGGMQDVTDYLEPTLLGTRLDPQRVQNFIFELWGKDSSDIGAKKAAKSWTDSAEQLRQRFNAAGGDIGHLDSWGAPQHHSTLKVWRAGEQTWIDTILPLLDRSRYYLEDGVQMSDADLRATLSEVYKTISTGGLNKLEPGRQVGAGMRANRGNESRFLHFATPEGWLDYQSRFGDKPIPTILIDHIEGLAKDIAFTETLGPNADLQYRYWRDTALKNQAAAGLIEPGKLEQQARKLDQLYNYATGRSGGVANAAMAKTFDTLRSWMVATRLGSAVITSLNDEGTMQMAALSNNLPEMQLLANELASMNPANRMEKRLAQRAGMGLETMTSALNRFGQENLAPNIASKTAQVIMRASGLNAWTEARRRAWGTTMMGSIGQVVSDFKTLANVDPLDHRILLAKGFAEDNWQVMRLAKAEDWGGGNNRMLTPDSIMRVTDADIHAKLGPDVNPQRLRWDTATKVLGATLDETNIAITEPGWATRAIAARAGPRGTLGGEIWRSMLLFKSFPIALMQKQWQRAMSHPTTGGKVGYIAGLLGVTTLLGAASQQINEMLSGRDPRNMADPRFAIQALLKGGSLGIYGDFLFSEATQGGQSPFASALGAVAGLGEEALGLTQGNLVQYALGKDTHAGAEAIRFVKGNIPGQNLWYAKAALDHLVFQQLQDAASPGYLARQQRRAMREFGQQYYWPPGQALPERPPDLGAAIQ